MHVLGQKEIFEEQLMNYNGFLMFVNTESTRNVIGSSINDFHEIRSECPWAQVSFVCNTGGIADKDRDWFVQHVLRVEEDSVTKVVWNDALYQRFHPDQNLEKLLYIHSGEIVLNVPVKHSSIFNESFLRNYVGLEPGRTIPVPDKIHASVIDIIRYAGNGRILYLSDLDETLFLWDIEAGEIVNSYRAGKDDAIEFYCRVIAGDEEKCLYASEHRKRLHTLNRSELYFSDVRSCDSAVTISAMLQVHEKLDDTFYFVNELGQKDSLVAGSMFANGYSVIIELDMELNLLSKWFLPDEIPGESDYRQPGSDFLHHKNEAGFQVMNILSADLKAAPVVSTYRKEGEESLFFLRDEPPLMPDDAFERMFETEYGGMLHFRNKELMYVDVFPYLYEMQNADPVYELKSDDSILSKCETEFAQFYEDREEKVVQFRIMGLGSVLEEYIGLLYLNCDDSWFMDVLTSDYRLVQRIPLDDFFDFDPWMDSVGSNIIFQDEGLLILTKNDDHFEIRTLNFVGR